MAYWVIALASDELAKLVRKPWFSLCVQTSRGTQVKLKNKTYSDITNCLHHLQNAYFSLVSDFHTSENSFLNFSPSNYTWYIFWLYVIYNWIFKWRWVYRTIVTKTTLWGYDLITSLYPGSKMFMDIKLGMWKTSSCLVWFKEWDVIFKLFDWKQEL